MAGLLDFAARFGTEERCIEHLAGLRWPDGFVCSGCGGRAAWRLKARPRVYDCRTCHRQESVTAGTVFHRTRMDLAKWFVAAYLMGRDKRGVSAKFLQPELAVVYQTAWTMAHKLRHGLSEEKLSDGRVVLAALDWIGKLAGFTLLFEALVLAMAQRMTFAAVAKLVNESWHRVHAICSRYVDLALAAADLSPVTAVAIDETSCRRPSAHGLDPWGGHNYLTIAADTEERKVVFVTEGKGATTIFRFAEHLPEHNGAPEQISSVSIDMSTAFIKSRPRGPSAHGLVPWGRPGGVTEHLPNARITFDKFHVVGHASAAVDQTRRLEQRTDPSLKGLRWTLLKDRDRLSAESRADLDTLIAQATSKRTARAWLYREHLREILDRNQINVVSGMLKQWCTNVSAFQERALAKAGVEPMKEVARMIRKHFDGIVAWTQTRQTNGFIEALNGLFQVVKRKARRLYAFPDHADRSVLFLIAGKLDFSPLNPHAA